MEGRRPYSKSIPPFSQIQDGIESPLWFSYNRINPDIKKGPLWRLGPNGPALWDNLETKWGGYLGKEKWNPGIIKKYPGPGEKLPRI